jgi:hypothetical protein
MNARLKTKPGDEASAGFLDGVRTEQARQLQALRAEIAGLKQRLAELGPPRKSPPF